MKKTLYYTGNNNYMEQKGRFEELMRLPTESLPPARDQFRHEIGTRRARRASPVLLWIPRRPWHPWEVGAGSHSAVDL